MKVDATVYRDGKRVRAGLNVDELTYVTVGDLHQLIDYLVKLERHMTNPNVYQKPNRL